MTNSLQDAAEDTNREIQHGDRAGAVALALDTRSRGEYGVAYSDQPNAWAKELPEGGVAVSASLNNTEPARCSPRSS